MSNASASPRPALRPCVADVIVNERAFVMRTVRRMGVPHQDVADAAQDVFLVFYLRAHAWDPALPVRAWLSGIARRVVRNRLRKAHTRLEVYPVVFDDMASNRDAVDLTLQNKRDRELLSSALAQLDIDKREVFVLYALEGLSIGEVAKSIGCPVQTAYSRWSSARVFVQRFIARDRSKKAIR